MKKTILIIAFTFFVLNLSAQTINIDEAKLLEFYQTQRYIDAAEYLKSVYPENTTDFKALSQMAYCNMMAGKLTQAENYYTQMNVIRPNTLSVLFSLANINAKRGNNIKAINYLQQIIKIDSNNFTAYKRLANLVDSASIKLNLLKKANQLNVDDGDVAFDLATIYRNNKDYSSAYQILKVAMVADTSNFILQQALLPIANQLEKYTEVIRIGEKLLQNGSDANVVKDVGKAYFFLKNYQKCINLYKMLEQMDIKNESIFYYLALSYRELKKYEAAVIYGNKTIEESISPNTASYYAMLGNVYEMDNKFKDALNAYKKGLTFDTNPTLYYRLGLLYDLKLKQNKNALKNYNLFIKSKLLKKSDLEQVNYAKLRIKDLTQVN